MFASGGARTGCRCDRGAVFPQLAERRAAAGVLPEREVFARKWRHRLPMATPCVIIDEERRVWILGNTTRTDAVAVSLGQANGSNSQIPNRMS